MAYMATKEPAISPQTTLKNACTWLNMVRYAESGVVVQLQDDCEYRIADIIESPTLLKKILGPYYRKYLLTHIQSENTNIESSLNECLISLLKERKIDFPSEITEYSTIKIVEFIAQNGFEIGIFISRIDFLLKERNFKTLQSLERLLQKSKNLSLILFFETDITRKKYAFLTDKCSLLFDHVIKYPFYDLPDTKQFIRYHNSMWHMKLDKTTEDEILKACGGYLWLISQAQRHLRDFPDDTIEKVLGSSLMQKKLETVWAKFSKEEKSLVKHLFINNLGKVDKNSHEFHFLSEINLIKESERKFIVTIPLLQKIIEKETVLQQLTHQNDHLYLDGKNITHELTLSEKKFLQLLLKNNKKLISRPELAIALWEDASEEKYSDWAIDRLAWRLRSKLITLGVDPSLLQTVKKKGFRLG